MIPLCACKPAQNKVPELEPTSGKEHPHALHLTERVRLMRDGIIHYSGIVVSGLAAIFVVPVMVKGLGAESYGLWVAALSLSGVVSFVDFGLNSSISREVSGGLHGAERADTIRFVRAAGTAYLLIGLAGGSLIFALGWILRGDLHLSPLDAQLAPWVFALVAVAHLADQIQAYAFAGLIGLRRFDVVNLIMVGFALVRAGGIIALTWSGYGLLGVAAWHATAVAIATGVALTFVGRRDPALRWTLGRLDWAALRRHVSFGLLSQLLLGSVNVIWETAPLLIGLTLGSAWITPFHIGMKFPLGVWLLSWRAAQVLFPAASEQGRQNGLASTRGIFEVGTRWILVLVLPFCIILEIVAPRLLEAWLGSVPPEAVTVLRLGAAAVLIDALGEGALQVMWGQGAVRKALAVTGTVAVLTVGLTLLLLGPLGIRGAALALLLSVGVGSSWFFLASARAYGVHPLRLVHALASGLLLPGAACAVTALASTRWNALSGWPGVITTCFLSGSAYVAALALHGGREEERAFVRGGAKLVAEWVRSSYSGLHRSIRG